MTKLLLVILILCSLPEFVSASSRSEISFLSFCKEMSTYDLNEIPSSVIFAEAKTHGLDTEQEKNKSILESAVYGAQGSVVAEQRAQMAFGGALRFTDRERYMAGSCFESLLYAYLPLKYKRLKDRELENERKLKDRKLENERKLEAEKKRIEWEQKQQEAKIREQERVKRMEALKDRKQEGSQLTENEEIERLERTSVEDIDLSDAEREYQEARELTESIFKTMEIPKEPEE